MLHGPITPDQYRVQNFHEGVKALCPYDAASHAIEILEGMVNFLRLLTSSSRTSAWSCRAMGGRMGAPKLTGRAWRMV